MALVAASLIGEQLSGVVIVDAAVLSGGGRKAPDGPPKKHRVFKTYAEALSRYRLQPAQDVSNRFLMEYLARHSIKEVRGGWSWMFDPAIMHKRVWSNIAHHLSNVRCPLAFVRGKKSQVVSESEFARLRTLSPDGTPFIDVPDANHHVLVDQPRLLTGVLIGLLAAWPK